MAHVARQEARSPVRLLWAKPWGFPIVHLIASGLIAQSDLLPTSRTIDGQEDGTRAPACIEFDKARR
jgi:hypothetical protein